MRLEYDESRSQKARAPTKSLSGSCHATDVRMLEDVASGIFSAQAALVGRTPHERALCTSTHESDDLCWPCTIFFTTREVEVRDWWSRHALELSAYVVLFVWDMGGDLGSRSDRSRLVGSRERRVLVCLKFSGAALSRLWPGLRVLADDTRPPGMILFAMSCAETCWSVSQATFTWEGSHDPFSHSVPSGKYDASSFDPDLPLQVSFTFDSAA